MKHYSAFAHRQRGIFRQHRQGGAALFGPKKPGTAQNPMMSSSWVQAGQRVGRPALNYLGPSLNGNKERGDHREKGWLGGGKTGRNSHDQSGRNYLQDPSAAIYEKSRSLFETMSQDLKTYKRPCSAPAAWMMLAQAETTKKTRLPAPPNAQMPLPRGGKNRFISPREVKKGWSPTINLKTARATRFLGAFVASPRRGQPARHDLPWHGAKRAALFRHGHACDEQCAVTGVYVRKKAMGPPASTPSKGHIGCKKLGHRSVAGHSVARWGPIMRQASVLPVESARCKPLVSETHKTPAWMWS